MRPDRVVIGVDTERARAVMASSTRRSCGPAAGLLMDPRSAELTKYAANAMLATRISFMNEIARSASGSAPTSTGAPRHGLGPAHRPPVPLPRRRLRRLLLPEGRRAVMTHGPRSGSASTCSGGRAGQRAAEALLVEKAMQHFGTLAGKTFGALGARVQAEDRRHARGAALTVIEGLLGEARGAGVRPGAAEVARSSSTGAASSLLPSRTRPPRARTRSSLSPSGTSSAARLRPAEGDHASPGALRRPQHLGPREGPGSRFHLLRRGAERDGQSAWVRKEVQRVPCADHRKRLMQRSARERTYREQRRQQRGAENVTRARISTPPPLRASARNTLVQAARPAPTVLSILGGKSPQMAADLHRHIQRLYLDSHDQCCNPQPSRPV